MRGKMNGGVQVIRRARAALLLLLLACWLCAPASAQEQNAPELFSYSELTTLYAQEQLPPALAGKLDRLLTTPFVDNSRSNATPVRLSQSPQLGEFLRIACWNIERGLEYDAVEAAFHSEAQLAALLDKRRFPEGSDARRGVLEQAALLRAADVIVLNEVDKGMKRTGYRDIAADLAARLGMNHAFGVQFVELSPVYLSGLPPRADPQENEILEEIRVDPERYKGLHGVAIFSRFRLENVRLMPFEHKPYDWFRSEKQGASPLEKGKRLLGEVVFLQETVREVRRGGRMTLYADIADARLPNGHVTIAATHLENRAKPSARVTQLKEILAAIKDTPHPVILAGDMNTSTTDLTPTSLKRVLAQRYGNPRFWAGKAISYALGFGFFEDVLKLTTTYWRKQNDPTVRHIPFFSPNQGRRFFTTLEDFRFVDGGAFDFRGEPDRSIDKRGGTLSASNERAWKGFVTSYQVPRPIAFVGKNKLDWFFVKPASLTKPNDRKGSYRFAPHFGRTLDDLNEMREERISDHRPILVDLPLSEPQIGDDAKTRDEKRNAANKPKSESKEVLTR